MSSRSLGLFLDDQKTSRSSLGQFVQEHDLPNTQKHLSEEGAALMRDDTDTTCSETVASAVRRASVDSSEWYSTFEPHHSFTAEENAILLRLSQELNGMRQSGIISIVEESTIATIERKRGVSRTIKRLSMSRNISIEEEEEEELSVASFQGDEASAKEGADLFVRATTMESSHLSETVIRTWLGQGLKEELGDNVTESTRLSETSKILSVASPEEELSVASSPEEELPVAFFRESAATVSRVASCLPEERTITETVSKKPCDFCHWLEALIDACQAWAKNSTRKSGEALQGHETKLSGRN